MKNNKGTPTKDTGVKNNNSDYDVDYKNKSNSENCTSATSNKASEKGSR